MPGIQFHLLVVLKRGRADYESGAHEASFTLRYPSGRQEAMSKTPLTVQWPAGQAEDEGVNLNVKLQVGIPEPGLYWIDVLLDARVIASTPFRVTLGPQT
jgi:hypothetical protein